LEIDPGNTLIVSRKFLDDHLLKTGIVGDYKEINRFLAGTLSNTIIRRTDHIKKSQYMKLVLKGVLRDSVKNIITFNKLGIDTGMINMNGE
jgi:hypothetical protein